MNFSRIRGQHHAVRAIEVALAGGHNLLIVGEPGGGKTTLLDAIGEMPIETELIDNGVAGLSWLDDEESVIMTTRPCPCGWWLSKERECTCSPGQIIEHLLPFNKIWHSIDMEITLSLLEFEQIMDDRLSESSETIMARIEVSREVAAGGLVDPTAVSLLRSAYGQFRMSAGSLFRAINVARTIAALAGDTTIGPAHMAEAISYRPRLLGGLNG